MGTCTGFLCSRTDPRPLRGVLDSARSRIGAARAFRPPNPPARARFRRGPVELSLEAVRCRPLPAAYEHGDTRRARRPYQRVAERRFAGAPRRPAVRDRGSGRGGRRPAVPHRPGPAPALSSGPDPPQHRGAHSERQHRRDGVRRREVPAPDPSAGVPGDDPRAQRRELSRTDGEARRRPRAREGRPPGQHPTPAPDRRLPHLAHPHRDAAPRSPSSRKSASRSPIRGPAPRRTRSSAEATTSSRRCALAATPRAPATGSTGEASRR